MDALKERRADGTALAGSLDHKQAPIDGPGLGDQERQVFQAREDAEIGWLVDHRLDPQRPAVLEVLLDAGVLVGEIDLDVAAGAEHTRAKWLSGRLSHLAGEHDRDPLGAADVDVLGDERFKEGACAAGVVEDERARDLDLTHRQLPPVARGAI